MVDNKKNCVYACVLIYSVLTFLILISLYFYFIIFFIFFCRRALEVITRVQAKLTGRDFASPASEEEESRDEILTVEQQVDR